MTLPTLQSCRFFLLASCLTLSRITATMVHAEDKPAPVKVPAALADTPADMKAYTEPLAHTSFKIDMVPIAGGKFLMGSPEAEANRRDDEGPQHEV